MITLAEAQASRALRIAGVCPESQEFIDLLNDGTRLLMKRGNWTGTIQFATACIYGNTVTWSRYVGAVLGVHVNGGSTIPQNLWFNWVYPGDAEARDMFMYYQRHRCGTVFSVDRGNSPVFNQICPTEPQFIQVFITVPADVGKTVTIFGIDDNHQQVITQRPDGTYQPGEVLTLGIPYVMTSKMYRRIDRIVKDPTQGKIAAFQWNPTANIQLPLAAYDPSETNPDYITTQVPNYRVACGCPQIVTGMVKLKFVPAQHPTDLVQVENIDALSIAMQSVKHSDAYDHQGAEIAMQRAVRDLNYELRDRYPLEQTVASFRPFGTASLQKLYLGMR